MTEEKKKYEETLGDVQRLADKYEKISGKRPIETYNRFALLYLNRIKLPKNSYKPDTQPTYQECKLMVGTAMLASAIDSKMDFNSIKELYYWQNLAKRSGWVLNHYDPIEVSFSKCVTAICFAFKSTTEYMPRASDIRICLQLGSPILWEKSGISDMIIGSSMEEMLKEAGKAMSFIGAKPPADIEELWNGTPFNTSDEESELASVTLTIAPVAFAQEVQRYIVEHWKFELNTEQKVNLSRNLREFIRNDEPQEPEI
jgi:hypothetical protein